MAADAIYCITVSQFSKRKPERKSAVCCQGCAAFPWDFPDTRAGAAEAAREAAADATRRAKATKATQPQPTPQWRSLDSAAAPAPGSAAAKAPDAMAASATPAAAEQLPTGEAATAAAPHAPAETTLMEVDAVAPQPATEMPPAVAGAAAEAPAAAGSGRGSSKGEGKSKGKGKGTDARSVNALATPTELAPLLPSGWWVARSPAALRRALPRTRLLQGGAQGGPPPTAAAEPTAASPGAAPAGYDAVMAEAEAAEPTQTAEQQPAVCAPLAAAALPAAAPAGAGAPSDAGGCLVRVRLQMTGRGVASAGAAVHAMCPLPAAASTGRLAAAGEAGSHGNTVPAAGMAAQQQQQPIGYGTAPAVRGACAWAGATALCSAAALDRWRPICVRRSFGRLYMAFRHRLRSAQ